MDVQHNFPLEDNNWFCTINIILHYCSKNYRENHKLQLTACYAGHGWLIRNFTPKSSPSELSQFFKSNLIANCECSDQIDLDLPITGTQLTNGIQTNWPVCQFIELSSTIIYVRIRVSLWTSEVCGKFCFIDGPCSTISHLLHHLHQQSGLTGHSTLHYIAAS